MNWLNYHHLHYFWVVAKEGGLAPAGRLLHLSHPTLSAQIHALENRLEEKLFKKVGRKLQLTEMGQVVFSYADEIFSLGREMVESLHGRTTGKPIRLNVGVVDVVPKFIVKRLVEPALSLPERVQLVCHEDTFDTLLSQLGLHTLDIVISDSPVPSGSSVRAFNHLLGETGVSFFASASLHKKYKPNFPQSLNGAPMLLPLEGLTLRRGLNQWFDHIGVVPRIEAEFEDSALMKVFGSDGLGVFAAPTVVEREVMEQYRVAVVGRTDQVRERFYAISIERKLRNAAVVAITETAKETFARPLRALRHRGV
jgi:LysR family transcriptional regulator, transcriptional activator of nhaA